MAGTVTINVTASDGTDARVTQAFVVTIAADDASNPPNPFAAEIPNVPTGVTALSSPDSNHALQFQVDGVTSGNLVEILADGNVIGQATASGTTATVTTDDSMTLPDGIHNFTAIQVAKNQTVSITEDGGSTALSKTADVPSFNSPAATLTIDTLPTATASLSSVKVAHSSVTFDVVLQQPRRYDNALHDRQRQRHGDRSERFPSDAFVGEEDSERRWIGSNGHVPTVVAGRGSGCAPRHLYDHGEFHQVSDSHGNFVASGNLLNFDPTDVIVPTVTIDQAADQADPPTVPRSTSRWSSASRSPALPTATSRWAARPWER